MNKKMVAAVVLLILPVVLMGGSGLCIVLSIILDKINADFFTTLLLIACAALVLFMLPCLVMSAISSTLASKAKKEGVPAAKVVQVLGIIEGILIVLGGGFLCCGFLYKFFEASMGV